MKTKVNYRNIFAPLVIVVLVLGASSVVYSHCQIPCGIYDDQARFAMISENIKTIEKSMQQIADLSKESNPNMNQIVRWIQNKEKHVDDISHTVTYYFMAQRLKYVDKANAKAHAEYLGKLTLLHQIIIYGTKARQTTDLVNVQKLRSLLEEFRTAYFSAAEHSH